MDKYFIFKSSVRCENIKLTIKMGGGGAGVERVIGGKLGSQIYCLFFNIYFVN